MKSTKVWEDVAQEPLKFGQKLDFTPETVEMTTDDFLVRLPMFALKAGAAPERLHAILIGGTPRHPLVAAGYALRVIFEIEGYYEEVPHGFTIYRLPKKVLITIGAIFIGIMGGVSAAHLDPIISGSISGLGSLFINIPVAALPIVKEGSPLGDGAVPACHLDAEGRGDGSATG